MKYLVALCLLGSIGCQAMLVPNPPLEVKESFVAPKDFRESEQRLAEVEQELVEAKVVLAKFLDKDTVDMLEAYQACSLLSKTMGLANEAGDHCQYLSDVYQARADSIRSSQQAFQQGLQKNAEKPIMSLGMTIKAQDLFASLADFQAKRDEQKALLYAEAARGFKRQRKQLAMAFHKFREGYK